MGTTAEHSKKAGLPDGQSGHGRKESSWSLERKAKNMQHRNIRSDKDIYRQTKSCLAGSSGNGTISVMAGVIREFKKIRIMVNDVVYMPSLEAPPEKPHPFVYFISIFNDSEIPVTIRGRKWVVREDDGEITVVEGDGVVGQTPSIEPGGHFSYNSYHVIARGATVSGAFFGETLNGEWIFARIPEFRLDVPEWA